jgi:hypothetical protein
MTKREQMSDSKNKERTSITIDPALLANAREYCAQDSLRKNRKVSFSELVSVAVAAFIKTSE